MHCKSADKGGMNVSGEKIILPKYKIIDEYSNEHKIKENGYWEFFSDWLGEVQEVGHKIKALELPENLETVVMQAAIRPYVYYREDRLKAEGRNEESSFTKKKDDAWKNEPASPGQLKTLKRHLYGVVKEAVLEKFGSVDMEELTKGQASEIIEFIADYEGWKKKEGKK